MGARGQVTVFVAIGVIILLAGGIYLAAYTDLFSSRSGANEDTEGKPLETYLSSCLEQSLLVGIKSIAQSGFYANPDDSRAAYIDAPAPINRIYIGSDQGNILIPDESALATELAKATSIALPKCLNGLRTFEDQGYRLQIPAEENLSVEVMLGSDQVTARLDMPFEFTYKDKTVAIKKTTASVAFRLLPAYRAIYGFFEEHKKNPEYLPLHLLSAQACNNTFRYEAYNLDSTQSIVRFLIDHFPDGESRALSIPLVVVNA
jgi:hypothetical protein